MKLPISPEKVAQVILLAREASRAAEAELREFIAMLDEDEQAALVAVMWIGRGTFDAEDLEEALDTAFAEATTPNSGLSHRLAASSRASRERSRRLGHRRDRPRR